MSAAESAKDPVSMFISLVKDRDSLRPDAFGGIISKPFRFRLHVLRIEAICSLSK